jgi:glycosyltransferase involved in cell wall biosynthesis
VTVDVVIPCFNAASHLETTIRSVLRQRRPPDGILVVDDGSTDASAQVAASFAPAVRLVRQANAGECAARNRGLDESKADWVAFLDADDVWEPCKLWKQLEAVDSGRPLDCVHTDVYVFGDEAERHRSASMPRPGENDYSVEALLLDPVISPSSALVRRTIRTRFPVGVRQGGDMLFFASMALDGARFCRIPEPLVGYRLHMAQVTREPDAWVSHFRNRFGWLENVRTSLGAERADRLRNRLQQQVIHWLNLARWNRQWDRYERLRTYARTLDWNGQPPPVLQEWILPRACYAVKDWFDAITATRTQRQH